MSDASTATEADFWHVQLPSGQVAYWSLEELDEAFQRDEVDAKTYVLKEGDTTWQRLGELLGLDEEGKSPDLVAVPVAPYTIAATVPPSVPPASMRPSEAPGALSVRPVVSDLSDLADLPDDDLVAAMKPKRKNLAAIGGGVVAALLLVVVGLTRASSGDDKVAAAAAAPPAAMDLPSKVSDVAAATPSPTLSDDVKRQLLEADKAREAKAAAKAAENAKYKSSVYVNRTPKSGPVFHKGGSQYDPLNAGN